MGRGCKCAEPNRSLALDLLNTSIGTAEVQRLLSSMNKTTPAQSGLHKQINMQCWICYSETECWRYGKTNSGVARTFPGGRVAHPESQNEEENKYSLRKNKKNWPKFEEKIRKVELLPTRACEAGYDPENKESEKTRFSIQAIHLTLPFLPNAIDNTTFKSNYSQRRTPFAPAT